MRQPKTKLTDFVRQNILNNLQNIRETERAESSLIDLSFQSTLYPERHIWIGVYGLNTALDPETSEEWNGTRKLCIDLEEWNDSEVFDNTIEYLDTFSLKEAIFIIERWINKLDDN